MRDATDPVLVQILGQIVDSIKEVSVNVKSASDNLKLVALSNLAITEEQRESIKAMLLH
jgi:hypothetical protein